MGFSITRGSSPSDYELLNDQIITGAAVASIDFAGLTLEDDNNYVLKAYILGDAACALTLALNNDTTDANYINQKLIGQLAAVAASCAASRDIGEIPSGLITMLEINFKKIAGQYTMVQVYCTMWRSAGGTPSPDVELTSLLYKDATNLTAFKLISEGGSHIVAGSRATLYRVP